MSLFKSLEQLTNFHNVIKVKIVKNFITKTWDSFRAFAQRPKFYSYATDMIMAYEYIDNFVFRKFLHYNTKVFQHLQKNVNTTN